VRSHDLNRLLDEPGPVNKHLFLLWKYLFRFHLRLRILGKPKSASTGDSSRHCNDPVPQEHIFGDQTSAVSLFLAELAQQRLRSTVVVRRRARVDAAKPGYATQAAT
jgi:hypothetical protein